MDIEILISQYIDGDLSSDAEAELHHILSVSPEARGLFRQQIAMRNIARDTRILHAPSVSLQNSLFERLQSEEGLHESALPAMTAIVDSEPAHSIPSDNAQLHRQTTSRRRKLVAVIMPFMFGVVMAGGAWTVYKSFFEKDGSQQIKEQKVLADYAPPAQSAPEMKSNTEAESRAPQISAVDKPNVASDAVVPRPVASPSVNPLVTRWTRRSVEQIDQPNDFRDKSDDEENSRAAKDAPRGSVPTLPLASTKPETPPYQPNVGEAAGTNFELGRSNVGNKGVASGSLTADTLSVPRVPLTRGHNSNEKTTLINAGGGYASGDDVSTEDGSGPATASRKKLNDPDVAPSASSAVPSGNSSPANLNNDSRALQQNYKTRVQDLSDQYKAAIQEAKSTNVTLGTTTTAPVSKTVVLKAPVKLKKAKAKIVGRARKSATKAK